MPLGRHEPEELPRADHWDGVRTGRAGNVGEGAGDARRRLQTKSGVRPAQHQLIVQDLKAKTRRWQARGKFDGGIAIAIRPRIAASLTMTLPPLSTAMVVVSAHPCQRLVHSGTPAFEYATVPTPAEESPL